MTKQLPFLTAEYIRLSREDGDKSESDSVGNQRKLITAFLQDKEEFILYDTYIDDGYTGTNFNRPAFRQMIADIEAGKVNCVIVKDLSRFGRDYIDTGKYLERFFPDHEIRFISITDNIDSFRQAYDMLLPIKNIFNEQYARDISGKIHASVSTKQKAGEFIGAFASYGYQKSPSDKNRLIIDDYAAGVVRRIFDLYISGCGKARIAGILNEQGIICPSEYKKTNGDNYRNSRKLDSTTYWTYSTINRLLQNEMYIGNMVQGRKIQKMRGKPKVKDQSDWIIVRDTHEAIIDRNTWEKTQDLLKRRTRNPYPESHVNLFAGFLKCGDCGRSLVKKGEHYYCGTYVRSGRQYCTPHPVPQKVLEKIVLDDLQAVIRNVDDLPELVRQNKVSISSPEKETGHERNRLQGELDKIRKLKKTVYEDYREELLSREEYVTYHRDYLKKEELLIHRLACLDEKPNRKAETDLGENAWISQLLESGTIETLHRDFIMEVLHEIKVYENHVIKIIYRFSDDAKTLQSLVCLYVNA